MHRTQGTQIHMTGRSPSTIFFAVSVADWICKTCFHRLGIVGITQSEARTVA